MHFNPASFSGSNPRHDRSHFDECFTAIVCPNGCGKSNLLDAVLWVLVEHRPSRFAAARWPMLFSMARTRANHGFVSLAHLYLLRDRVGVDWTTCA